MEYDYYEDRPQIPAQEHSRRVRHQVQVRTELRSTIDPFAISTTEFYRLYRMTQQRFWQLVRILSPFLSENRGSSFIPKELKVLCAVGFYAQGSYQRPHGRNADLNLSQASVSICIEEVTTALNNPAILTRYVHFPATREERERVIERNAALGLPGVLGYIDGTLVRIVPPGGEDGYVYRSRKGYTALNVQIVCNSDLYIFNVNARFPGSANDPYIYRMSPVREMMRRAFNDSPCWLLGDSIYPHEPWLQLPILHAEQGTPEYRYTRLHCNNRNCVERCIGVLKARWRCLLSDRTLHYAPVKAGKICNACVVLHNFLVEANERHPRPIYERQGNGDPDEPEVDEERQHVQQAIEVRGFLVRAAQERYERLLDND